MGYQTRMHGQFTITPPIPWISYHDKPFDPDNQREWRCLKFIIEPVAASGGLIVPVATGLKVEHSDDGTPDIEAEFEELFAMYPGYEFHGILKAQGEGQGDLWRLVVDGRTTTRVDVGFDPATVEPNAPATLTLTPGRVVCSSEDIRQVLDEARAKAWEISLTSKYPGSPYYGIGGAEAAEDPWTAPVVFDVHVPAGDRTLYVNDATEADTTFAIHGLTRDWIVMAEAVRYTVRIVAYRPKRTPGD